MPPIAHPGHWLVQLPIAHPGHWLAQLPIAHPGHWLVQLVYFLPVVAFLIWLGITQYKARREDDEADPGNSPGTR